MKNDLICLALPKGDALSPLSKLLDELKFPIKEYHSKNRTYRPEISGLPLRAKIMAEKDVALQVAAGNYDIGFCGLDWAKEHSIKYRASGLLVYKHLSMLKKDLYLCTGNFGSYKSIEDLQREVNFITIISEYPNLAENFAISSRLKKYKIFSAWGSVESYPHEHADAVLIASTDKNQLEKMGLFIVKHEMASDLCIVANKKSLIEKDLSQVLDFFSRQEATND